MVGKSNISAISSAVPEALDEIALEFIPSSPVNLSSSLPAALSSNRSKASRMASITGWFDHGAYLITKSENARGARRPRSLTAPAAANTIERQWWDARKVAPRGHLPPA